MTNLVRVPWQPNLFLADTTLALFENANRIAGATLMFNGADSCLRTYEQQSYLYNGYVHHLPGFNVAANPDTGQRSHMRGAAGDLIRTDEIAQNACRQAGLIRDPYESWHWNNPNWANMPIINDSDIAALNSKPIGGFLMALSDAQQDELYVWVKGVKQAVFEGGPDMPDAHQSIGKSLAQIRAYLAQPVIGRDRGDGKLVNVSQIQDNADTNTIVRELLAQIAGLQATLTQLSAGNGDPAAITKASYDGAKKALSELTITMK